MVDIKAFNSYAHADQTLAGRLCGRLTTYFAADTHFTFKIWRDSSILPGEEWHEVIQQALRDCPCGLLFLSPAFFASGYIKAQELKTLLSTPGKVILPVMLERVDFVRQDLEGVEKLQVFQWQGKSYEECKGTKNKFELALFQAIHDRLEKVCTNG